MERNLDHKFDKFSINIWDTPASIYLFKVNNRNIIKKYEICSKFTKKTPEGLRRLSGVFSVNLEQIPQISLVFLLLNFNK